MESSGGRLVDRFKQFVQEVKEKTRGAVAGVSEEFVDRLISKVLETRVRPILEELQKWTTFFKETSESIKEVREVEKQLLNTLVEIREILKNIDEKLLKIIEKGGGT